MTVGKEKMKYRLNERVRILSSGFEGQITDFNQLEDGSILYEVGGMYQLHENEIEPMKRKVGRLKKVVNVDTTKEEKATIKDVVETIKKCDDETFIELKDYILQECKARRELYLSKAKLFEVGL